MNPDPTENEEADLAAGSEEQGDRQAHTQANATALPEEPDAVEDSEEEDVQLYLPPPKPTAVDKAAAFWRRIWLDLLVFTVVAAISAVGFYQHARGDLYSDEADYALASVTGFEANRWDQSDSPKEPDRLVAARHFH